ncbi:MAG: CBS domain-containing protein [Phycisphaerales bacterium]|nr:MAG: CBS domain-containing protein [Phycisphaerales bacterium]
MSDTELLSHLMAIQSGRVPSGRLITSCRTWLEVGDVMSKNVATASPGAAVVSAAKLMSDRKISSLVIMDKGDVAGILTETDVLRRVVRNGKNFYQTKLGQIMSYPVETVPTDLSVLNASEIMGQKRVKRLPALEKETLAGIVTQTDLVRALTSYGMWRDVSEIMSQDVAVVQKTSSVAEAAEVMTSQEISCIVVLDGEEVTGVLTEKDLLGRVVALHKDPASVTTEQVMSSPVTSIPSSHSVFSAGKTMEEMNVRRLIVTKDKRLCGIVTQTDIFMAVRSKLQIEEQKHFMLLEESKDGVYTANLDGLITYVNPAFVELLEVPDPAELIGRPFLPERFWLNPEEKQRFLRELKKGFIESKELSLKTFNGRTIYVVVFCSLTKDIHGGISGSQGIVYDITPRKEVVALRKAEEQLRQSREEIEEAFQTRELLLEEMPVGMIVVGRDKKIRRANKTALRMMGCSLSEQLVGTTCHRRICPAEANECPVLDLGQSVDNSERTLLHSNGEEIPILKTVLPVSLAGEEVLLEAFVDITERRQAEQALERLNEDLESAVWELTRANKELQEFAYIAAHDLKTPLRGIGTLADWISKDYADKFDEPGKEQVRLLVAKAKQMTALIDDILQYSRVGQSLQAREQVDLNEVLTQIIAEVAPPENIEITVEDKLPSMRCKRTHVVQILQNLLGNAVKYMDKPRGQVKVGCVEQEDYWKFSVADNGPGINKNYFDKIFKIFQTLAPRDGVESTGIGLSIVKKLVELNKGRVWVESEVGKGSTFFFTLPK